MFYDFHRTSAGGFCIYATVQGSYGEMVYSQVGRNYTRIQPCIEDCIRRYLRGEKAIALVIRSTGTHIPVADVARAVDIDLPAVKNRDRSRHGPSTTYTYPVGTWSSLTQKHEPAPKSRRKAVHAPQFNRG